MAIYEYKCPVCKHLYEIITPMNRNPIFQCEKQECAHAMLERQISVPARAQFKGAGFYETDYKKAGK